MIKIKRCLTCGNLGEPYDTGWIGQSRMRGFYCCEECAQGKSCVCEENEMLTRAW
jgi:hypothetical protein